MDKPSLVTAHQLADLLNLSVETVWRHTRNQRIPYITLGERQYRYSPQAVIEVLAQDVRESKQQYESRSYTYDDYLKLPESMMRTEIIDGTLIQEPAPLLAHQNVLLKLYRLLEAYFTEQDPEGVVYVAPVDVTLSSTEVVQPDLLYVSGERLDILTETRVTGAPDLIAEIISPSSARKDRFDKFAIYQRFCVPHYWLVDAPGEFIETYSLNEEGLYVRTHAASEVITVSAFPGLEMDLTALWPHPAHRQ